MRPTLVTLLLASTFSCGGTDLHAAAPDPLVGDWQRYIGGATGSTTCAFFANHEWSNTCSLVDGWAKTWERTSPGRYYIGATYSACDTDATFSVDLKKVTLSMYCGSTEPQVVELTRFR